MSDVLIAAATVEPLTLAQAKEHLGITLSDDDVRIARLIRAARSYVESVCGQCLVLQSRRLFLPEFPNCIEIMRAPVRAVQAIQYLDTAGATQTLATDQYRLDKFSLPARIVPEVDAVWPETRDVPNAVWVDYTAGYLLPFTADAGTDVLTVAGHGFADADITQVLTLGGVLPTGLSGLTNYHVRDATANTLKLSATAGGSAIDITAAGTVPNALGLIPEEILAAMTLLVAHWNENREGVLLGVPSKEVEIGVADLLSTYRIQRF